MKELTRPQYEELLAEGRGPHVTIYSPTIQAGPQRRQNAVRIKNALAEAKERGHDIMPRSGELEECLAQLGAAFEQSATVGRGSGLAAFARPGLTRLYATHTRPDPLVIVGDHFHLTPMVVPFNAAPERFLVLSLNTRRIELYDGDAHSLKVRELPPSVPRALEDVVGDDVEQQALQNRSWRAVNEGTGTAQFHAHGGGRDTEKAERQRFFAVLAQALRPLLDATTPLVVAGVESQIPLFLAASRLDNPIHVGVRGNHAYTPLDELHQAALETLGNDLAPNGQIPPIQPSTTASNLREVMAASFDGRVRTLSVDVGRHAWGQVDPERRKVTMHRFRQNHSVDLVDVAVRQTLLTGGELRRMTDPSGAGPAAVATLRY